MDPQLCLGCIANANSLQCPWFVASLFIIIYAYDNIIIVSSWIAYPKQANKQTGQDWVLLPVAAYFHQSRKEGELPLSQHVDSIVSVWISAFSEWLLQVDCTLTSTTPLCCEFLWKHQTKRERERELFLWLLDWCSPPLGPIFSKVLCLNLGLGHTWRKVMFRFDDDFRHPCLAPMRAVFARISGAVETTQDGCTDTTRVVVGWYGYGLWENLVIYSCQLPMYHWSYLFVAPSNLRVFGAPNGQILLAAPAVATGPAATAEPRWSTCQHPFFSNTVRSSHSKDRSQVGLPNPPLLAMLKMPLSVAVGRLGEASPWQSRWA